jgi:hypothetical protein
MIEIATCGSAEHRRDLAGDAREAGSGLPLILDHPELWFLAVAAPALKDEP